MENTVNLEGQIGKEKQSREFDVTVKMDAWDQAGAGKIIGTRALGSCTGLIVYDETAKHSYVGHFIFPSAGHADELLNAVKNEVPDRAHLKAFLAGSAPLEPEIIEEVGDDYTEENRSFILNQLKDLGIPEENITTSWATSEEDSADVSIDNDTGEIEYIKHKVPLKHD